MKIYNAVNIQDSWNLLIKQAFLSKNIDPYMYLDRYLTMNETEEVLSYPFKSKEQVDRIIEMWTSMVPAMKSFGNWYINYLE